MVLRHDYIASVWIRQNDPHCNTYTKYSESYIPEIVGSSSGCYCGFPIETGKTNCSICSSAIFKAVQETSVAGIIVADINKFVILKKLVQKQNQK